jgi:hypothetical protein
MNRRLGFSIRLLWVLGLLASLGMLFAALPGYFTKPVVADPAAEFSTLALAGRWLNISFSLSAALVSLALACLLFWKKADDTMALFLSFFLLLYGIILAGPLETFTLYWLPQSPDLGTHLQSVLIPVPMLVLILIFPTGRFVPRWTRGLVPLAVVFTLLALTFDLAESVKLNTLRAGIIYGSLWLLCLFAMGIQAYRYRALYTPVERQQTKWVVYGTALWATLIVLNGIPYLYLVNQPADTPVPWWSSLSEAGWWLTLNILPIAFTLAIMRSRLWDIEVIIRRTLVYGALTLTLGLVYVGCIVVSRALVAPLTGSSELAIVASTLAIAALFNPLRRNIQRVIDKRFYRRKYDAAKVLASFGATARDETDLERLTAAMLEVVDETMQPEHMSLWLRPAGWKSNRRQDKNDHFPKGGTT